ncbi:MAG: hypothetical protein K2P30_10310 [Lachnospiraceae bacterium]|nr:hypothetical protein [Lachnospiraceae bacterium]
MIKYISDKIKVAELVLVGLGEELDAVEEIKKEEEYQGIANYLNKKEMIPFAEKLLSERKKDERCHIYEMLAHCLENKNYFIVSLCKDGFIRESSLDLTRVVEPCGGYDKLQCADKCCVELYDVPEKTFRQVKNCMNDEHFEGVWEEPVCPHCGKPLIFNNVNAANYVEEGYLEKWLLYKKWLQGTVNKSVCILEVGVGMKYPTVVRWPFEKISFYNRKAEFFRIHSKLYQIPKEMKDNGHGICQRPEEFIKELSENF